MKFCSPKFIFALGELAKKVIDGFSLDCNRDDLDLSEGSDMSEGFFFHNALVTAALTITINVNTSIKKTLYLGKQKRET